MLMILVMFFVAETTTTPFSIIDYEYKLRSYNCLERMILHMVRDLTGGLTAATGTMNVASVK